MFREQGRAYHPPPDSRLQQLPHRHDITIGLAHGLPLNADGSAVEPVVGQRLAFVVFPRENGGLGHLELMMGIEVVIRPGVNVEVLPEVFPAHRHALDMPARKAAAPGTLPAHLVQLIGAPEIDVERVPLLSSLGSLRAILELGELRGGAAAEATQLLVAGDVQVEISTLDVGGASLLEQANRFNHLFDMFAGLGVLVRSANSKRPAIGMKEPHLIFRQFPGVAASPPGGDLYDILLKLVEVADIRQVHHLQNLVAGTLEVAAQNISQQVGAELADVNRLVDGRTAVVHAHLPGFQREKIFQGSAERILQLQRHEDTSIRLCFFLPARSMIQPSTRSEEVSTLSSSTFSSLT